MVKETSIGNEEPEESNKEKLNRILEIVGDLRRKISDYDPNRNIERLRRELKGLEGDENLSLPKIKEEAKRKPDIGYGCLGNLIGVASIVATFSLGPIDFGRSVYNQIVGDTPVLKRQLTDYVRRGIQNQLQKQNVNQIEIERDLEAKLSEVLNTPLKNGQVNSQDVPISTLWVASEEYANSIYSRFIWPSLK